MLQKNLKKILFKFLVIYPLLFTNCKQKQNHKNPPLPPPPNKCDLQIDPEKAVIDLSKTPAPAEHRFTLTGDNASAAEWSSSNQNCAIIMPEANTQASRKVLAVSSFVARCSATITAQTTTPHCSTSATVIVLPKPNATCELKIDRQNQHISDGGTVKLKALDLNNNPVIGAVSWSVVNASKDCFVDIKSPKNQQTNITGHNKNTTKNCELTIQVTKTTDKTCHATSVLHIDSVDLSTITRK